MTTHGVYYFICGGSMLLAPLRACYKKFGSIDDEAFTRWLIEQPFSEWLRLRFTVLTGFLFMSLGLVT